MKKILVFLIMLLNISLVYGAKSGSKSLTFLNIAPNARVAAMGEGFTALADDVSAVYWNPAGLGILKNTEVGINYNLYFEDMSYINFQFAGVFDFGTIGLNVSSFNYGSIDNYINGNLMSSIKPSDMSVSLSYGFKMIRDLYFGITGKYISEKLTDNYKGISIAGDAGLLYCDFLGIIKNLNFAVIAMNIGSGPKFDSEKNDLPMTLKGGFAYKLRFARSIAKLKDINFTIDLIMPSDSDSGIRYGTELWWYNLPGRIDAAVRFGIKAPQDLGFTSGITFGGGIRLFNVQIDYALVDFGDLGKTHRMGASYKFGKINLPKDINIPKDTADDEEDFDFEEKSKFTETDIKKEIKEKKKKVESKTEKKKKEIKFEKKEVEEDFDFTEDEEDFDFEE